MGTTLQDCHGNTQGHLYMKCTFITEHFDHISFPPSAPLYGLNSGVLSWIKALIIFFFFPQNRLRMAFKLLMLLIDATEVNFSSVSLKACCLTAGVGVGMVTFSGLYSSLLHLRFHSRAPLVYLPQTSSSVSYVMISRDSILSVWEIHSAT